MAEFSRTERADFRMTTEKPSQVVTQALGYVKGSYPILGGLEVLDIGCGDTGRNTKALAAEGMNVVAVDLPDFENMRALAASKATISFQPMNINQILVVNHHQTLHMVVLARVIQYLDIEQVGLLLQKLFFALKRNGIVALSYTADGGIFNDERVQYKHKHSMDALQKLFDFYGFEVVQSTRNEGVSGGHNGRSYPILTYDIVLRKQHVDALEYLKRRLGVLRLQARYALIGDRKIRVGNRFY